MWNSNQTATVKIATYAVSAIFFAVLQFSLEKRNHRPLRHLRRTGSPQRIRLGRRSRLIGRIALTCDHLDFDERFRRTNWKFEFPLLPILRSRHDEIVQSHGVATSYGAGGIL